MYRNKLVNKISKEPHKQDPYIWHADLDQDVDELINFREYFIFFVELFPFFGHRDSL